MMDLGDLRAFVRIAELKSVSAAARALRAPKSSMSRSLARLEAEVGMALVDRSTRHLRLTDAGTLLQPHALRILLEVQDATASLSDFAGVPRGTLRINAPVTFAIGLIGPMAAPFMARFPEVRIVLDVENRQIDVLAEEVDLVIRIGVLPDSQLIARRLESLELWGVRQSRLFECARQPRQRGRPGRPHIARLGRPTNGMGFHLAFRRPPDVGSGAGGPSCPSLR